MLSLAGLVLIGFVLRDLFHVLFHPTGRGSLSSWIPHLFWRGARRSGHHRLLPLAAPAGLVTTIALWGFLLGLGWALIYLPQLDRAFLMSTGLEPEGNDGIVSALYVSFVTLATLGYGDIAPTAGWLRILAPAEAAVGFALLTASLTWMMAIHPAVSRKRSFAHRARLLQAADVHGLALDRPELLAWRFVELAGQLTVLRQDILHYTLSYYFHDDSEGGGSSFPETLLGLRRLSDEIRRSDVHGPTLRGAADEVWQAIEDYGEALRSMIPGFGEIEPREVLEAYRAAHSTSS